MQATIRHVSQKSCLRQQSIALLRKNTKSYSKATLSALPMKAGTQIPGLNFIKDREPVVALERSEYPEWVGSLATPDVSLAALRRMPEEEATDRQKMRYLKLTRRGEIKEYNESNVKK
jgi:hypothetical protein